MRGPKSGFSRSALPSFASSKPTTASKQTPLQIAWPTINISFCYDVERSSPLHPARASQVGIPMPRIAAAHVRDAIALPFLFETSTILRLLRTPCRRTSAGASRPAQVGDEKSPADTKSSSFLKAKAGTSKPKSTSSRFGTSITAAERRVFDDIFNHVASNSPSKNVRAPQQQRDHFLDHEDILAIFSSAVSGHVKEQKAMADRQATPGTENQRSRALDKVLAREEEVLQRYPKPLRKAARRATAASLAAKEHGTRAELASRLATESTPKFEAEGHSTSIDSGQADHDRKITAQNHLGEADERPIGDGLINKTKTPLPGLRPSFLVADKKDEDIRRGLRPSFLGQSESIDQEEARANVHIEPKGPVPPFVVAELPETYYGRGVRPSFLTVGKRAEAVASFAEHYGTVRPSFIRRAEDAAAVKAKLQHEPESVFQGTIHRYCREQMEKIADSFQSALKRHGDIGIWNTCLAKVFPMIELLDTSLRRVKSLRDKSLPRSTKVQEPTEGNPSETPRSNATKASSPSSPAESPLPDLPPYVPPLYIISRLYPAALLLAFRLLRRRFPISRLTLALLPQIRSLGPTSYVLGASTEFYNALIELRWDVYSDLQSIDGLLMEMERNGVEFDVGTWNVLVKIRGERVTDLHDADKGTRGAAFWERPSNMRWFQKVAVEWKMVVAARLREQGLDAEITEREYGTVSPPQAGPSAAEPSTVWL